MDPITTLKELAECLAGRVNGDNLDAARVLLQSYRRWRRTGGYSPNVPYGKREIGGDRLASRLTMRYFRIFTSVVSV